MRDHLRTAVILIGLITSSCNLAASQNEVTGTPLPADQPTLETPTSSAPTLTPAPTQTLVSFQLPTVTATSPPSIPLAIAIDQPVNCRFGPATSYAIIGALNPGKRAEVIGQEY